MPRKGQPSIALNSIGLGLAQWGRELVDFQISSSVYHAFYFVHLTEKNLSAPFLDALKLRPSRTTQRTKVFMHPIK